MCTGVHCGARELLKKLPRAYFYARHFVRCMYLAKSGNNNIVMIKPCTTVNSIKQAVESCGDGRVNVKLNLGRNKFVTFPAVVSGVYPAIFTVRPLDKNFLGRTSYSYTEVLCGRVKITSCTSAEGKKPN